MTKTGMLEDPQAEFDYDQMTVAHIRQCVTDLTRMINAAALRGVRIEFGLQQKTAAEEAVSDTPAGEPLCKIGFFRAYKVLA